MNNFLAALRGETHEEIPVWFMRQAGRYLPGYRGIRTRMSIREMCRDVDTTVAATLEPVKSIGVDAAIIFADIMLPVESMGFSLDFVEGVGPAISNPFKANRSLSGISDFSLENYGYKTYDSIRRIRSSNDSLPVIGFSGGPLTIASYLVNGRPDRDLAQTKELLLSGDRDFRKLLRMITEMVIMNSREQIRSGASTVQIFDSWAGYLSPGQFSSYAENYLGEISSELNHHAPLIYFSTQTSSMSDILVSAGFSFLSLDWRCNLHQVMEFLGGEVGLQGNLDPAIAEISRSAALEEGHRIASSMSGFPRYIFNLGHGVLPGTNPETLKELVKAVHSIELKI